LADTVIPPINQEVLAAKVGTTRSRINFFMNKFRKLGFIEYNRHLEGPFIASQRDRSRLTPIRRRIAAAMHVLSKIAARIDACAYIPCAIVNCA